MTVTTLCSWQPMLRLAGSASALPHRQGVHLLGASPPRSVIMRPDQKRGTYPFAKPSHAPFLLLGHNPRGRPCCSCWLRSARSCRAPPSLPGRTSSTTARLRCACAHPRTLLSAFGSHRLQCIVPASSYVVPPLSFATPPEQPRSDCDSAHRRGSSVPRCAALSWARCPVLSGILR